MSESNREKQQRLNGKVVETHLAEVVNAQVNTNQTIRTDWKGMQNALTKNGKTYAVSTYTKTRYVKKKHTKQD